VSGLRGSRLGEILRGALVLSEVEWIRMTIWELPGNNWRNDGEEQMNVIGWKMK
jgi:hypothetical protein